MRAEDLLGVISVLKDKTGEVKLIMDDLQRLAEHLVEVAKIGKSIVQKVEEIKK